MARQIPARPFGTPKPTRQRRHEIAPELREALWARCGGLCELCGQPLKPNWDAHHRKPRSQGGEDSVSNLLALHRFCHRRVHSHPTWAYETGFLVPRHQPAARWRLALHGERWVRLRRDGAYEEAA